MHPIVGLLIGLIILCVILGFLWWAGTQLIGLVPQGGPFPVLAKILMGAVVLVVVLIALKMLFAAFGVPVHIPGL